MVYIYILKREPRNKSRRTYRVSGGIAQLFLNFGTRRGLWSASRPGRLYPRERPGTHCTGGWVGPGAGLDGCEKSRPTGFRSPDLPARSESLYRLSYRGSMYSVIQKDGLNFVRLYFLNYTWYMNDLHNI
jgi:hypothetical protein